MFTNHQLFCLVKAMLDKLRVVKQDSTSQERNEASQDDGTMIVIFSKIEILALIIFYFPI